MTKYLVRISKDIEVVAVVEAESLQDASSKTIDASQIVEVIDVGYDVIWSATELVEPVTFMTQEELLDLRLMP